MYPINRYIETDAEIKERFVILAICFVFNQRHFKFKRNTNHALLATYAKVGLDVCLTLHVRTKKKKKSA